MVVAQAPVIRRPFRAADPRLNFHPGFFNSFVQRPVWDNFVYPLQSIQSQHHKQKENYAGFSFNAFKSEIKFHTYSELS